MGTLILQKMKNSWELIRRLNDRTDTPWMLCGDFNEILFNSEKMGGHEKPNRLLNNFRKALNDCKLMDMGYFKKPYTWIKKREDVVVVKERLDSCVCSSQFYQIFPLSRVKHLDFTSSDHCPLEIVVRKSYTNQRKPQERRFRFEEV